MPALQSVPSPQGGINTLLGRGSSFDGKLTFEGTVRIDGKLTGEIFSDDVLVIGEGAEVRAKIEVGTLIVRGQIDGNVKAGQLVELHAPARVRGNLKTPQLFIDKGVVFEGNCKMEGVSGKAAPRPRGGEVMRARLTLALLCVGGAASAEESRWNVHLMVGPGFTVVQPVPAQSMNRLRLAGLHLRGSAEYMFHSRVGVELGYGYDMMLANSGAVSSHNTIFAGARIRPWYHKEGGYLLPRPAAKDRKPLFIGDIFSDAWVDVHAGVNLAGRVRFIYDVGIGTRVAIISPLQIGLFVRWQHMLPDQIMQVTFGASFSIGFLPVHNVDADDDGVTDDKDKCPGTRRGTRVNDYGCEWRESETKTPTCGDSDLDGVCDGHDDCPDTKMGASVDKKGCPVGGAVDQETPPQ